MSLKKSFLWTALTEDAMLREAIASVSLDKESGLHTCHDKCQNPKCVERRKAKKPKRSRARKESGK